MTSLFTTVQETIHGVCVLDPYRWLEDRSLPETDLWLADQARRCKEYFLGCDDLNRIRARVRTLLDVVVVDQPARVGGRYFYRRRDQGQQQAGIYVRDVDSGSESLLVAPSQDPLRSNKIHRISEGGHMLAYEVRYGGSSKSNIEILDVRRQTRLDGPTDADWSRGLVFDRDGNNIFSCLDVGGDHVIRRSAIGESRIVGTCFRTAKTNASRLLLLSDEEHLGALHLYKDEQGDWLDFWIAGQEEPAKWRRVFRRRPARFFPTLAQRRIFALTYEDAIDGRYAEFDGEGRELRTVIPGEAGQIRQVSVGRFGFIVHRFEQMQSSIRCWNFDGEGRRTLAFPAGSGIQLLPSLGHNQESVFYSVESFTDRPAIYEYNPWHNTSQLWHRPSSSGNDSGCKVDHLDYSASDGEQIPLTVISPRAGEAASTPPGLMTTYGGFAVPAIPQYSVLVAIMLELGVRFALPHVRGGGDFGNAWHEAGRGQKRQRSINDFLDAAHWLSEKRWVDPRRLAIFGGSNSGLLVGAAMTQRPALFRAVLCIAPLLDMVRYESFDDARRWSDEFGTVQDAGDFRALFAYSPYHHVAESVDYPATLFVSGDGDDKCNPAHVRKMAAALQGRQAQHRSILVDYSAWRGHNPVLPLSIRIEAMTRRIAFLCTELGISLPTGGADGVLGL